MDLRELERIFAKTLADRRLSRGERPGSDVARLRRAGVAVRFDQSPDHMHHKFAVFDRRLLATGSYNWTRSAARNNHENIAITDDPRLVEPYRDEFDRLWELFAPRR